MWSGINRIDIPIPVDLQNTYPRIDQNTWVYDYITELDDVVWYHSGGWNASGVQENCPRVIREFFRNQYLGATSKYLTDLSLQSVVGTQAFLKANDINYKMAWMYDTHNTTNDNVMYSGGGSVDKSSQYYKLVDWSNIHTTTAYEWCRDNNLLGPDKSHWSRMGALQWFDQELGIKLTKPLAQ